MRFGTIEGSPKPVSRIVCGCDRLRSQGAAHLDAAFARGINAFDTARAYWGSERVLGEWMQAHGVREQVFVITKGGYPHARQRQQNLRRQIQLDIECSLRELRTDHVDLYLLHYDAPDTPAGMIVEVMNEIKASGKARALGVSNFSLARVQEIQLLAHASGESALAAVSVQLSLPTLVSPMWPVQGSVSIGGEQGAAARAWYACKRMPVLAYSCLGRGFFSSNYWNDAGEAARSPAGAVAGLHGDIPWLNSVLNSPENREKHLRAAELGRHRNATAAQIALAYVLQTGLDLYAVLGWSEVSHCELNVAALELDLDEREIAWLELTVPGRPPRLP